MIQLWCIIDKGRWQNAMFKQIRKIALLFSIVGTFCVTICHTSYAQQFDYMSAADFAKYHGGKEYVDILEKKADKNEKKILCGDSGQICNAETQICLKCSYKTNDPNARVFTFEEKGKCVAKRSLDISNLRASWPDDGNCLEKRKVYLGGYTIEPGIITIEEKGFLSDSKASALFVEISLDTHKFTDSKGKSYLLTITNEGYSIEYAGDSNFNGCEVLPVKVYNMQGCFFCPLARLIFATANSVTSTSFAVFAYGFKVVITVVFAIWLALAALQQVFSFTKQDAPKFLAAIVKQGFKYMVAFFLLASSASLFELFIIPVLDSGLKLGAHIQTVEMKNISKNKNEFKATNDNLVMEESYFNMRPNKGGDNTRTGETLYERIEGFLKSLQSQLAYMQAIGTSLFCVGAHSIITVNIDNLIAGFRMMLLGGIIAAFGFLLTIAFAFYFLDAILQLAIVGAMLPFMIAGWPFKATAQYAGTGFKMLLNTFFVFFFTGFVVSVNIVMVDQALSLSQNMNVIDKKVDEAKEANGNDKKVDEEEIARQEMEKQLREETSNGFEAIASAMNAQNISELREKTDIGGVGFMLLVFSCLFGFKFVQEVPNLANTLSSGGIKGGLAGKIGTMGASTVKGMATKVSQPIAKEIAGKYHEAGGIAGMALAPVSLVGGLVQSGGEALENKSGNKFLRGVGKVAKWTGKAAKAPRQVAKKVHSPFRKPKL